MAFTHVAIYILLYMIFAPPKIIVYDVCPLSFLGFIVFIFYFYYYLINIFKKWQTIILGKFKWFFSVRQFGWFSLIDWSHIATFPYCHIIIIAIWKVATWYYTGVSAYISSTSSTNLPSSFPVAWHNYFGNKSRN